jgi:hypothetical protein
LKVRHRIFIPVEADPMSLREVDATPAGDGQFRIVGVMPRNESLQFKRGEVVECEIRKLPGGSQGLVAVRSASADPEFRKRRNVFAFLGGMVGGILGLAIALWFETSATSAAVGFASGAVIFGFSSVRWGDSAWMFLSHILDCE